MFYLFLVLSLLNLVCILYLQHIAHQAKHISSTQQHIWLSGGHFGQHRLKGFLLPSGTNCSINSTSYSVSLFLIHHPWCGC